MFSRLNICRFLPATFRVLKSAGTTNLKECFRSHVSHCTPCSYISKMNSLLRSYSVQVKPEDLTVDFEYIKKATANVGTLIVDVREPDEVKEHGKIPNSINIPLGNVSPVLGSMPEKEFHQTYNRPKPVEDTEIIFYCMIGKRSGKAQQNALNLGFKNAKNYLGSWNDWASKTTQKDSL